MNLFPYDEHDLPSYNTTVALCAGVGATTVIWSNLLQQAVFYKAPHRIVIGAAIGAIAGHFLNKESIRGWRQIRARDEYKSRLQFQELRDLGPLVASKQH